MIDITIPLHIYKHGYAVFLGAFKKRTLTTKGVMYFRRER